MNTVLQREPAHAVALTLIAQAYRFKALYPQSIETARKAIQQNAKTAEPATYPGFSVCLERNGTRVRRRYAFLSNIVRFAG